MIYLLYLTIKKNEIYIDISESGDEEYRKFASSPNIYNLLTNNQTNITWGDLDEKEKVQYGKLLVRSGVMKNPDKPTSHNRKVFPLNNKWNNLFSHIWFNRYLYDDPNREFTDTEIKYMNLKPSKYNEKTTPEAKTIMKELAKKLKGSGIKTNYITLPSDPMQLVNRLELLHGSKEAGNTGVHNEIVSICDELLRQKIIGKGQYKKFLSNI